MKRHHPHKTMIIIIFTLLFPYIALAIDTITLTTPLTVNQTLVSKDQSFELGFNNSYVGIWYKNIQPKTFVWIANRDKPLTSLPGSLAIGEDGNVIILDKHENTAWSSNQSFVGVKRTVAQLLDSGNFVIRHENDENPGNYLWQSFENPTDTLIPGMKLGWTRKTGTNRFLQSWKSDSDPGSGCCSFKLNTDGFPEVLTWKNRTKLYRSGAWMGRQLGGAPEIKRSYTTAGYPFLDKPPPYESSYTNVEFEFQDTSDEISYTFRVPNNSVYSRLIIDSLGVLRRYTWIDSSKTWSESWSAPLDQCDNYKKCGPNGICDTNYSQLCTCMTGFEPKNQHDWDLKDGSAGCVRLSKLNCTSDGFLRLKNIKLPESSKVFLNQTMNLTTCGEICKRNCSCAAYANMYSTLGGLGCVMWEMDLIDMRQYADSIGGGQDLYIIVADYGTVPSFAPTTQASPFLPTQEVQKGPGNDPAKASGKGSGKHHAKASGKGSGNHLAKASGKGSGNHLVMIVTITAGVTAVLITLVILFLWRWKILQLLKNSRIDGKGLLMKEGNNAPSKSDCSDTTDEIDLPLFDFTTLVMATKNFSNENMLGHGGFGSVYKGVLPNGEVVAIKRLSRTSGQGIEELRNEVRVIAKLQHRNLVRLLGCCIEVQEKLLVYEYMENKSLNTFIFDKEKGAQLNWEKRFDIISGITRGLLYLHQDSRLRIIHRDLKTSNVLLDKEMNPRISDFGLARMFGSNQTEAKTTKVVGTHGYMAPEYAMNGLFSTKSDVFSFGVLLLEIVSGKRNRGFYFEDEQLNLLGHTWKLWNEGNALELLDESIGTEFSRDEVSRCIHIGLLCVQEQPEQRPDMARVWQMLRNDIGQLPQPRNPGLRSSEAEVPINNDDEFASVNDVTITILDGR